MTAFTDTLLDDLVAGPTSFHVAAHAEEVLTGAGFTALDLAGPVPSLPGRYLCRRGGFLAAWIGPAEPTHGYLLVGAHTDSPGLRVRPRPERTAAGLGQLGVEVYGGPLLYTWLDRDLGVAGRVGVRTGDGVEQRLLRDDRPVARIPSLAIHLAADMQERGGQVLHLNPQEHLTPIWSLGADRPDAFRVYLAGLCGTEASRILSWDVSLYDVARPSVGGRDADLLLAGRLDNQLSCVAGVHALAGLGGDTGAVRTPVLALWDHEEVGSQTADGAGGALLAHILERISAAAGLDRAAHLAALAGSLVISADAAHATHPAYPAKMEPTHPIALSGGVVVKRHAQQRYATASDSESFFRAVCADAGVTVQAYSHRADMPCGSTIGPMTAARLAVPTIDIGVPLLGMHSISETAAPTDVESLRDAITAVWTAPF